ncbi:hypothetical protein [Acinetobacter sp. ANC 3813]|uniref:hypothetical protein n=1 Tax=Acinetobacter sp. ANC 3813 TaxID=1977873 RepID=UPI000A35138C|nr:hypothetical protein [Acinetobacter sp. ANC 3813]OTG87368.1 hypothetical protein B9T34_16765 [Acinetobacter sp. ANC 3813]
MSLKFLLIVICLISTISYAADLSGDWKIIDDKTGVSLAKLKISKMSNGSYEGRAIEVLNPQGINSNEFKNFLILSNLREDPKKYGYFTHGLVVDPIRKVTYKNISGKLNSKETMIILRGKLDESAVSRRMSWIRIQ